MKLKITVHGVAYEVDVEVLDAGEGFPTSVASRPTAPRQQTTAAPAPAPQVKSTAQPKVVSGYIER